MNVDNRQLEPTIAAWLADGLDTAAPATRRAIAAGVERTRQRRVYGPLEIARPSRLLAVAALLVALAAVGIAAGGLRLILPSPEPSPTVPMGPLVQAVLDRNDRHIPFAYQVPVGLDLAPVDDDSMRGIVVLASEGGERWLDSGLDGPMEPGAHGIAIADVTGATEHGSTVFRPVFGATAEEFLRGLDASAFFVVADVAPATVAGQQGWSARITTEGEWWTHIDVYPPPDGRTGSVEFSTPNVTFITDVGEFIVMIVVWADTAETLAAWQPQAMPLVESIRFGAPECKPGIPCMGPLD